VSTINGTGAGIEFIYVVLFIIYAPRKEKAKMLGLLTFVLSVFGAVALVHVPLCPAWQGQEALLWLCCYHILHQHVCLTTINYGKNKKKLKKGEGYQAERRQLSKVITYGMPENCSVDLCHMILLKVILPQETKKFHHS
jgi:hypothetical protein